LKKKNSQKYKNFLLRIAKSIDYFSKKNLKEENSFEKDFFFRSGFVPSDRPKKIPFPEFKKKTKNLLKIFF